MGSDMVMLRRERGKRERKRKEREYSRYNRMTREGQKDPGVIHRDNRVEKTCGQLIGVRFTGEEVKVPYLV